MKYRDMTPERREAKRARQRKRYAEQREAKKAYQMKYNAEHREERKKYYAEHREEHNARRNKRLSEDLNKNGVKKSNIRNLSGQILKKVHAKLDGYEIHHCFGYEDPERFIYIPRKLHREIHSLLYSLHIPAEDNHWNVIRDMVNSCEEYTYVRC